MTTISMPMAPNQSSGAVNHGVNPLTGREAFPPVRPFIESAWRSLPSGAVARIYQRNGMLLEVEARESAVPGEHDIEDYELWLDNGKDSEGNPAPNLCRISMSPTVNRQVMRHQGNNNFPMHLGEASGFKRCTSLTQVQEVQRRGIANREADRKQRALRDPAEQMKAILQFAAETQAEKTGEALEKVLSRLTAAVGLSAGAEGQADLRKENEDLRKELEKLKAKEGKAK